VAAELQPPAAASGRRNQSAWTFLKACFTDIAGSPDRIFKLRHYPLLWLFLGDKQMPRPNLASMSVDELLKLRDDISRALYRKANELRSQLSMLGHHAPRGSLKGRKVPPKYRSPLGETWAGRGARPRWLVAAIKRGKKADDFLIAKRRRP
jgi:DNA-binding protein H-NS